MKVHQRSKMVGAVLGLVIALSSCTIPQLDVLAAKFGISLSSEQREALLPLPDAPVRIGFNLVHADGSVTTIPHVPHANPAVEAHFWSFIAAGWPDEMWVWASCVTDRESGGNRWSWNRLDAAGGSRGLMQINGSWRSWLKAKGIITQITDLFDPVVNYRAALAIYLYSGEGGKDPTRPWSSRKVCAVR